MREGEMRGISIAVGIAIFCGSFAHAADVAAGKEKA
jgi:hypothetical protein